MSGHCFSAVALSPPDICLLPVHKDVWGRRRVVPRILNSALKGGQLHVLIAVGWEAVWVPDVATRCVWECGI